MGFWNQVGHFVADHYQLLLHEVGSQVLLSLAAVAAAIVIALPVGVLTGHLHRWSFLAISGGNALRRLSLSGSPA